MPTDPTAQNPADGTPDTSGLLEATILDVSDGRVSVLVPELDGGAQGRAAFGYLPDASPDETVYVQQLDTGELIIVSWQPS